MIIINYNVAIVSRFGSVQGKIVHDLNFTFRSVEIFNIFIIRMLMLLIFLYHVL